MKKTITLTKMLVLAIMLVSATTAFASFGDEKKCRTKCCKAKQAKELKIALAEMEKAIRELETELKTVTAVMITSEVKQSLQQLKMISKSRPVNVFAFATAEEKSTVEAKYRIDFSNLNKEMDTEQEKMTSSPAPEQKINFSNLAKEMDDVQLQMSSADGIRY